MIDYDDVEAQIDRLHEEAEDLAALAKATSDRREATELRRRATTRVRRAARLRAQIEDSESSGFVPSRWDLG